MDTDENVKPFSCSLCPSTFTQRGNLLRHIATIHEGKKRTDVSKGQLNSELIYEVIVSLKMPTKNFPDFCSNKLPGQKSGIILVGILGETMTS